MPEPSIHYRRRWYYALWVTLLLISASALFLWERPARIEQSTFLLDLHVKGAPEGTRIQAWAGPWASWKGERWAGDDSFGTMPLSPDGKAKLPPVRLHVARRRWGPGTIPRGTWELVMIRFLPPQGAPVYLAVPCSQDIRAGLIKQGRKLMVSIDVSWKNLQVDARAPLRVP